MFKRKVLLLLMRRSGFCTNSFSRLSENTGIIVHSPAYSGCSPVPELPVLYRNVYLKDTVLKLTKGLI